jgi:hypothetical protein
MNRVFVLLCLALIATSFVSLAVTAKSVESVVTQLKLK